MVATEHMRIDPAYRERLAALGLDSVTKVLERVDGRITAWSRTTDTLYVPGADGTPGFYVKRHFFPSWVKRLRGTFRGTFFRMHRGQAEYRALNAMRCLGIPAVRAVAYGGRRVAHFLTACFLITEEVPDGRNLTTFALDVMAGRRELSTGQRHALVRTLADQVAAMHATGFAHGNMFWRNLLVREGLDGKPEFFFLDAQPPHTWRRWSAGVSPWLRELAQLAVSATPFTSRTDRLRFVRRYFSGQLTPEVKPQLRQIERLATTWRRHEERRIRMNGLFEGWSRQLLEEERAAQGDARARVTVEPAP